MRDRDLDAHAFPYTPDDAGTWVLGFLNLETEVC